MPDEYAFALGALSHYAADITGHPAVNQAVAITYPKLRAKFGPIVLYAQDKTAHIRTEFGFDMAQVAKQRYAPQQYHDFIGFEVSKDLLERVFPVVYGIQLEGRVAARRSRDRIVSVFGQHSDSAHDAGGVCARTRRRSCARCRTSRSRSSFIGLSRADYEKSWGKNYQRAGFGVRFLAVLLKIIPKVGPLEGAGLQRADAEDRKPVLHQHQQDRG